MSKESKRIQRATERAVKKMEDRRVWIVLTDSIHPPEIRYASLQSIVTPPMAIPKMVTTFTSFSQARDYALGQIMEYLLLIIKVSPGSPMHRLINTFRLSAGRVVDVA